MGPFVVLGDPCVDDSSSASFNSQPSHVFRVEGTDTYVMMADRWVPDYVMTKERYDTLYRVIYSRVDKTLHPSVKDVIALAKAPLMGSADTSQALYVWIPFTWEGDFPKLHWQETWSL